jgi:hypothetical protein
MSTEYSAGISIGYRIPISAILKKLRRRVPGKFHMEPRFSPTDGSRVQDEKVIDEVAHWVYDFKGETFDDDFGSMNDGGIHGLLCVIAQACESSYSTYGTYEDRANDRPIYVVFGPGFTFRNEMSAAHNFNIGGSVILAEVFKKRAELRRTRHFLKGLGFKPGKARIFTDWDVG